MAVIKHTQEFKVRVSPKRMFKAMVTESYTVLPKIMPGAIKGIDLIHGDGGVGTIRQTNFPDGSIKHKIDALDVENCTTKYSMIEGVWLGDKLESVDYEVKFEPSNDGGCVVKIVNTYHTKGDAVYKDEEIKVVEDQSEGFYRVAEEYLVANPNVCA